MRIFLQLLEAQQLVDEIRQLSRKITMQRQALTGISYSSFHRHVAQFPFSTKDMKYHEALITTVRRQVLIVYQTTQALKAEYAEYIQAHHQGHRFVTTREVSLLSKDLKRVYATFADELDLIELRARDERRDVESGACDERLRQFMLAADPGMQEQEVLRELKVAKQEQRTTNINKMAVTSLMF